MPLPFDVFISYRQATEGSFVRDILVPRLDAERVRVFVDFREFGLGEALVKEMARAVEQSRYTLVLASPAYFASEFTEFENVLAQQLGLESAARRLIVATRQPCELPLRLRSFLYMDWTTDRNLETGFPRLLGVLRAP